MPRPSGPHSRPATLLIGNAPRVVLPVARCLVAHGVAVRGASVRPVEPPVRSREVIPRMDLATPAQLHDLPESLAFPVLAQPLDGRRARGRHVRVFRQRWQLFQPSQAPLGPIMLDHDRVDTTRAVSALMKALPGFALQLDLTLLDPAVCKLPEDGGRGEFLQHCTTMAVVNEGSFEEYFNTRPRKFRSNLRRYAKRLQQDGFNEHLERVTDPEAVADAVDQHGDIESAGWKGCEGTAMHPTRAPEPRSAGGPPGSFSTARTVRERLRRQHPTG